MENLIEVSHAVKKFREYRALDDVTLSFEQGKIHGSSAGTEAERPCSLNVSAAF